MLAQVLRRRVYAVSTVRTAAAATASGVRAVASEAGNGTRSSSSSGTEDCDRAVAGDDCDALRLEESIESTLTYNPLFKRRGVRLSQDSKPEEEQQRRRADSAITRTLPLATDAELRDAVVTQHGELRFGVLLEYLDAMAGNVAYRHVGPAGRALTIVTAACDRIRLQRPLDATRDLRLDGYVVGTGRSSMAIVVDAVSVGQDGDKTLLRSLFTMVARDPVLDRAARVPTLVPQGEQEERVFAAAAEYAKRNKERMAASLYRTAPSSQELEMIHSIFTTQFDPSQGQRRPRDGSVVPVSETEMRSTLLMVPQERNIHNKIFGGFLMRSAYELAWITAHTFLGERPVPLGVDDVNFLVPVEIGDILRLSALVACTSRTRGTMQVRVCANVLDPTTKQERTTNVFHFAFQFPENARVRTIPVTYEEAMWFLAARRKTLGSDEVDALVFQ